MSDDIDALKDEEKENMINPQAPAEPPQQSAKSHSPQWIGGVILIAVGLIFLFSNISGFYLQNWWALFILIPAIGSFGKAWQSYRANGRFTREASGPLTGGLVLTLIATAFLFNLDWGMIWPFFLIIGGLSALLGGWFN